MSFLRLLAQQQTVSLKKLNSDKIENCYEIGQQLGKGGFAVVFKGVQKTSRKEVAVKFLDKQKTKPRQIQSEVDVMSEINHPNIVCFLEIFDTPNQYQLVMELVTGGELLARLIKLEKYTEQDAKSVMQQFFAGLQHLHEKLIMHRDLKPENLLLSSSAPNAIVKIADFGISKKLSSPNEEIFDCIGSAGYMAPEQIAVNIYRPGMKGYSLPIDLWACGVILYLLLSGKLPWKTDGDVERTNNAISRAEYDFSDSIWRLISNEAKDLISKLLQLDIEKRLTISQAIRHPWFSSTISNEHSLQDTQDSLREFLAARKFKAAVRAVMAIRKMKFTAKDLIAAAKKTEAERELLNNQTQNVNPIATAKNTTTTNVSYIPNNSNVASAPKVTATATAPTPKPKFGSIGKTSTTTSISTATITSKPTQSTSKPILHSASTSALPILQSLPIQTFSLNELKSENLPPSVDKSNLPKFLHDTEFLAIFKMSKVDYYRLPFWKQQQLKKLNGLF
eukprot:TRINITY_DN313_c0_g4_i2.p1 TRINITY_DN313_c0_g4~~TRINITY_DN313_c0_g4_i2.p1  ORF type:complete len:523 (+),score=265.80 TRINITY_DN313_c0_g4_i2:52-1569(+)